MLASRQYPQGTARRPRHCGLDPQSKGAGCDTGQQQDKTTTPTPSYWLQGSIHRAGHDDHIIADLIRNPEGRRPGKQQDNTNQSPSPLMETFAKLSGTAIICSDSQSAKLDFPIDSRLRRNDGEFCKGLLDGRGIKGEGENDAPASSRHCGLDPQSRGEAAGQTTRQHQPISLSLDGRGIKGEGEQYNTNHIPQTIIADLVRNPEGQGVTAVIPCAFHRHSRVGGNP